MVRHTQTIPLKFVYNSRILSGWLCFQIRHSKLLLGIVVKNEKKVKITNQKNLSSKFLYQRNYYTNLEHGTYLFSFLNRAKKLCLISVGYFSCSEMSQKNGFRFSSNDLGWVAFTLLTESNYNFLQTSLLYTKNVQYRLNLRYLLGAIVFTMRFLVPEIFFSNFTQINKTFINRTFFRPLMFGSTNKIFFALRPTHFFFRIKLFSLLLVVKNYLMLLMYIFVSITTQEKLIRNCISREVLEFSSTLKHFPFQQGQK